MPADVTVLRGDTARPGPQRGLVHTLLGQLLALTPGASSLLSLGCRFLLPTVRMKSSPRDVPENHMGSSIIFLVLTRYQVLDLQLGCMKKKRNSRDNEQSSVWGAEALVPPACPHSVHHGPGFPPPPFSLSPVVDSCPVTMFPTVGKPVLGSEPPACRL